MGSSPIGKGDFFQEIKIRRHLKYFNELVYGLIQVLGADNIQLPYLLSIDVQFG